MNGEALKRRLALVVACFVCCNLLMAQKLVAYRVVGDVTYMAQGKPVPLTMNAIVDYATEIDIPDGAKVELLDEAHARRLILKHSARGHIKALADLAGNSVVPISAQYLAYIKKQMTNKRLVAQQRYVDFASITNGVDSVSSSPADNFPVTSPGGYAASLREAFNEFRRQSRLEYENFRAECNKKYIEFVRKAWTEYGPTRAIEQPIEPRVDPVPLSDTLDFSSLPLLDNHKRVIEEELPLPKDIEVPLPPIQPIEPIKEVEDDNEFAGMPFSFYGTNLKVRLDEAKRINVGKITPDRVADALQHLSTPAYDNLLFDCLKIRDEHRLCDWAYLLMLQALTDQYCGAGTDESALLLGYLYCQSGYKARFATDNNRLYLLVASDHVIFGRGPYAVGGEMFYPLEDVDAMLSICEAAFPKERTLSLYIPRQPLLAEGEMKVRKITSARYPDLSVEVAVNSNLLDFYGSYPSSYIDNDFTTRWAMYANTPMAENVRESMYPVLQEKLAGLPQLDAVNRLLNFVQTGLTYGYDEEVWGADRAFFAEESLHYPFCDCEDRAILFTRLVRDILHMKCVLIFYPGHLAAAVHFDEQPGGVFYTSADGTNYTLCDPTYIGAGVGMEMPQLETSKVKLIQIKP